MHPLSFFNFDIKRYLIKRTNFTKGRKICFEIVLFVTFWINQSYKGSNVINKKILLTGAQVKNIRAYTIYKTWFNFIITIFNWHMLTIALSFAPKQPLLKSTVRLSTIKKKKKGRGGKKSINHVWVWIGFLCAAFFTVWFARSWLSENPGNYCFIMILWYQNKHYYCE